MSKSHLETKGKKFTPEYRAWCEMKKRCRDPKFKNYHGRGITVHPAFQASFSNFLTEIGRRPSALYSLERIDNNRGYEPGNIRWATREEQIKNRRTTVLLTFGGTTHSVLEWSRVTGIPFKTIKTRIRAGWDVSKALTVVPNLKNRILADPHHRMIEWNGEMKNLSQWAKSLNMCGKTIQCRLDRGWSVGDALSIPSKR